MKQVHFILNQSVSYPVVSTFLMLVLNKLCTPFFGVGYE